MKSKVIKRCSDCGRFLSEDDFHWANKKKGWKRSYCKQCHKNGNWVRNSTSRKELEMEYQDKYYKKHRDKKVKYQRENYKQNKSRYISNVAKRKAMKLKQTPELTETEQNRIKFIYEIASTMSNYHVDHIQPLSKGGLHCSNNLQILHKDLNLEKHNKYPLAKEEKIRYNGFKL